MRRNNKHIPVLLVIITCFLYTSITVAQEVGSAFITPDGITATTIISDNLQGSTKGKKVGGSFTSEGYKPGAGTNHILYTPPQIKNGYLEFEFKGFSHNVLNLNDEHGFAILYDGRGVNEPIKYGDDFRENYFRWNVHWRQNKNIFKAVIACAAPTTKRLNSSKAVYPRSEGRDWFEEPKGGSQSWNTSKWYKMKIEWNNKKFTVSVDGVTKWSAHGPYDYAPVDFRIWLGSGTGKYDAVNKNVVYRNMQLVSYGSSTPPTNNLSVTPSNRNVSSSKGSTTFDVSSNNSWSVSDNVSWLNISSGNGSNNGSFKANYSENTGNNSRTATITVTDASNSRKVTVFQAGKANSGGGDFTVSPTSKSIDYRAGSFNVDITTNDTWKVSDNTGWLSKASKTGTGNGTATILVEENRSTSTRSGIVYVVSGGVTKEIPVTQSGSAGTTNNLSVSPLQKSVNSSAGSATFSVTSNSSWRISENSSWVTVSPESGSNNSNFTATFSANSNSSSRSASINITSGSITRSVKISQSGKSSSGGGSSALVVNPSSKDIGNEAGSFVLSIETAGSWRVRDNAGWLAKSTKSGSGNGTSKITYKSNTTGEERRGIVSVTVGSETVEVIITQGGSSNSGGTVQFAVSPTAQNLGNGAGSFSLTISAKGSWRVKDNTGWLSKSPKSGSGNGTSVISYKANTSGTSRSGIVSVISGNKTIEVGVTQRAQTTVASNKIEVGSQIESNSSKIEVEIPDEFGLYQNYPNPFNPTTNITFSLPISGSVKIEVYNLLGQKVRELINAELNAGYHSVTFNASDLASGIYIYRMRMQNNEFSLSKKMHILK